MTSAVVSHCAALLLVLVFAGHTCYAREAQSAGSGGDRCGNKTCIKGMANCVNDKKCICKEPFKFGDGILNCYKKNEFRTEVTNDPHIITYNNHSIDLPIPCRYLLTHAVTEYKDQDREVVGSCESMVHAFHRKAYGKFYVSGYSVAIRVECNNGSRYKMSIQVYGKAEDGVYRYYINGTDDEFWPNGPFKSDNINFHDSKTNLKIRVKIDGNNNLAKLEVRKCGFRIRFRPYDCKRRRDQTQVPGLAVAYNCAFHPEFESVDRVLALPPKNVHNGFDIDSIEIEELGKMGTMMYRAYMSGVLQNHPDPNPACATAKVVLEGCPTMNHLKAAFDNCLWILRSPRFIRCYDKSTSGVYIQDLFNRCAGIYCGSDTCDDVIYMIEQEDCMGVPGYDEMSNFISGC